MLISILGALCVVSGLTAMGVGLVLSKARLERIRRVQRSQHVLLSVMPEGWGAWFFQGFADMTIGAGALSAIALLAFWIALGMWIAGIGIRLAW